MGKWGLGAAQLQCLNFWLCNMRVTGPTMKGARDVNSQKGTRPALLADLLCHTIHSIE